MFFIPKLKNSEVEEKAFIQALSAYTIWENLILFTSYMISLFLHGNILLVGVESIVVSLATIVYQKSKSPLISFCGITTIGIALGLLLGQIFQYSNFLGQGVFLVAGTSGTLIGTGMYNMYRQKNFGDINIGFLLGAVYCVFSLIGFFILYHTILSIENFAIALLGAAYIIVVQFYWKDRLGLVHKTMDTAVDTAASLIVFIKLLLHFFKKIFGGQPKSFTFSEDNEN